MDGYGGPYGDVQIGLKLDKLETKVISLLGKVSGQITEPDGSCRTNGGHVTWEQVDGTWTKTSTEKLNVSA